MGKQNQHQTLAQLRAQCNTSVSKHSILMTLLWDCAALIFSVNQVSSSTTPTVGLGTPRLGHGKLEESVLNRWITISHSSRRRLRYLPGKQLIFSFAASHKQAGDGDLMLWRTFTWAFSTVNGIFQQESIQCHKARIMNSIVCGGIEVVRRA